MHTLLAILDVLNKKLVWPTIVPAVANVSQPQVLLCDFSGSGHDNGNSVPKGFIAETHYANNLQRGNLYYTLKIYVERITLASSGVITQV